MLYNITKQLWPEENYTQRTNAKKISTRHPKEVKSLDEEQKKTSSNTASIFLPEVMRQVQDLEDY